MKLVIILCLCASSANAATPVFAPLGADFFKKPEPAKTNNTGVFAPLGTFLNLNKPNSSGSAYNAYQNSPAPAPYNAYTNGPSPAQAYYNAPSPAAYNAYQNGPSPAQAYYNAPSPAAYNAYQNRPAAAGPSSSDGSCTLENNKPFDFLWSLFSGAGQSVIMQYLNQPIPYIEYNNDPNQMVPVITV